MFNAVQQLVSSTLRCGYADATAMLGLLGNISSALYQQRARWSLSAHACAHHS